jgi:hypothetical protein
MLDAPQPQQMTTQKLIYEKGPYHAILTSSTADEFLVPYLLERLVRYKPAWLIPGYLRHQGGEEQICYDITGLCPLDQTDTTGKDAAQKGLDLLCTVCGVLLEAADLLMPARLFRLHPSLIYMDQKGRIQLLFWPLLPEGSSTEASASSDEEQYGELTSLARSLADAYGWPQEAVDRACQSAGKGPAVLLNCLQDNLFRSQVTRPAPKSEQDSDKSGISQKTGKIEGDQATGSIDSSSSIARKGLLTVVRIVLVICHLLLAAAVLACLTGWLAEYRFLLIAAALLLFLVDLIVYLKGHPTLHKWFLKTWNNLAGNDEHEGKSMEEEDQTILLAPSDAEFRMAMLSEGQPGTPAEHEGERAFILVDEFVIGRDPKKCDLCLPVKAVGRTHARIIRRSGSFFIVDLGSGNGTLLDGKHLPKHTECLLPDKCQVQFANCPFYFQAD